MYFLPRDGQILFDIAQRLLQRIRCPIEARYLYVSRLSTNLAATYRSDVEEVVWILREMPYIPANDILSRLDMSWEEVADRMYRLVFRSKNQFAYDETVKAFKNELLSDPMRAILIERAERKRRLVVEYLRQEGVLSQKAVGLKDLGGVGSQMQALHALITKSGSPAPHIFLTALSNLAKNFEEENKSIPNGFPSRTFTFSI